MNFWFVVLSLMGLAGLAGLFYLVTRFRKFGFMQKIASKSKLLSWLLACAFVALFFLFGLINVYSIVVVVLHLTAFWIICDIVAAIVGKHRGKRSERYIAGIVALAITTVYMTGAWIAAHHVWETDYTITSDKVDSPLRIALIADSHLGITLDGEDFAKEMEKVQAANPDVVVIVGDYVDDDSEKADMLRACEALGDLNTAYGVFFVYGNHDMGYYEYRDFSSQELRDALTSNGVTILEDETVPLGDDYILIGRRDRSMTWRASAGELMAQTDASKYSIMLDHQPNDYDAEAAAGADLVLSGHTHGGHMFPAGYVGLIMKSNDSLYGLEQRGTTNFIVTSGISGWAVPFKSGTHSEYVIVDVIPAH